jgi:hypothetical protein
VQTFLHASEKSQHLCYNGIHQNRTSIAQLLAGHLLCFPNHLVKFSRQGASKALWAMVFSDLDQIGSFR